MAFFIRAVIKNVRNCSKITIEGEGNVRIYPTSSAQVIFEQLLNVDKLIGAADT